MAQTLYEKRYVEKFRLDIDRSKEINIVYYKTDNYRVELWVRQEDIPLYHEILK